MHLITHRDILGHRQCKHICGESCNDLRRDRLTLIQTFCLIQPHFRIECVKPVESTVSLSNDAVALAQAANMEVIFRTKTPHCDRLRIEKRKGVFGRVASLLSELDTVSNEIDNSQLPATPIKLKRVNETVDRLLVASRMIVRPFDK